MVILGGRYVSSYIIIPQPCFLLRLQEPSKIAILQSVILGIYVNTTSGLGRHFIPLIFGAEPGSDMRRFVWGDGRRMEVAPADWPRVKVVA